MFAWFAIVFSDDGTDRAFFCDINDFLLNCWVLCVYGPSTRCPAVAITIPGKLFPENLLPFRHRLIPGRIKPLPSVVLSRGRIGKATDGKEQHPPLRSGNRFSDRLPEADYRRLASLLQPVTLRPGRSSTRPEGRSTTPTSPPVRSSSALTLMQDGNAIEVATVGNEGARRPYGPGGGPRPTGCVVQVETGACASRSRALHEAGRRAGPWGAAGRPTTSRSCRRCRSRWPATACTGWCSAAAAGC